MSKGQKDHTPDRAENSYPPQVEQLHAALRRLVGVRDVRTGLKNLGEFPVDTSSRPTESGELPHALLRRSGGGLPFEFWAHTELVLAADQSGWLALEFLAWWVRDLSRSGDQIQIRPMALPPRSEIRNGVQLGKTLKFIIDHLVVCPEYNLAPLLNEIQYRAESLSDSIDAFADVLGPQARPPAYLAG